MNRMKALVRRGDLRPLSPAARWTVIGLAVLTPLLIAGASVSALHVPDASGFQAGSTTVAAVLPAAIVNDDQMVEIEQNGTKTPVLAGKLLVSQLTSGQSGTGFDWTVTDASTASDGLSSGRFSAVVTIPSGFSASYVSLSSSDPTQATLQVQTNGAGSYVGEMLASALSNDLQSALSSAVTSQYVETTLGGFTQLHDSLAPAASGSEQLATGAAQLSDGAGQLSTGLSGAATGATALDSGARQLADGMQAIASATSDLPTYAGYLADGTAAVSTGVGLLRDSIGQKSADVAGLGLAQAATASDLRSYADSVADPAVAAQLRSYADRIDATAAATGLTAAGLGFDTLGGDVLQYGSGLVSDGAREFADDLPQLSTGLQTAASGASQLADGTDQLADGLGQLSAGSSQLASGASQLSGGIAQLSTGLDQAVTAIPTYTAPQAKAVATVVAQPVVTQTSDIAALPGPAGAIAAVAVPVALWIGALVLYLVFLPFTRSALLSTASTLRVVLTAVRWPLLLGLAQALLVVGVLLATGAHPAHLVGGVVFAFVMAVAFVLFHQGLVALLGQAGRILSLALVVVQVVAAAVIIPAGLSSPAFLAFADVLPLTHAITGMQLLVTGGSLPAVLGEAVALAVTALVGLVLSLVAAARARGRDLVASRSTEERPAPTPAAAASPVGPVPASA